MPGGGAAWASPWAMYAALRDHDPVHHVVPDGRPHEDYYVLSRHEDVLRAAVDTATFSSAQGLTVEYGELEKIGLADNPPMVMLDPPEHTAFRKLVSRGLHAAGGARGRARGPCVRREKLDGFVAAGGGDIVVELFKPLPSMVVAHYLGVPAEDRDRFDGWTDAIVAASSAGRPDRGRGRDDGDARLLLRADRAPPRRARRRHRVAPGRGRRRRRRRRAAERSSATSSRW